MKLLLIATIVAVISVQVLAIVTPIDRKAVLKSCKEKTGVDPALIEKAFNEGIFEDDPKFKETSKCFYQEIGVMEGNEIIQEELLTYLKLVFVNKNESQIRQKVQECFKKEKNAEETAFKLVKCIYYEKK